VSIAAMVAALAAASLVGGTCMEPEQSTMITSAASAVVAVSLDPLEVTVTIALTSRAPSCRYSFW
jgi:hypothetical protein